jgi:hypothetical protein
LSIVYTVLSIIIIIIIVVVVIFYMHTAACRISFWILLLHPVFDIEGLSKPFKFIQEFDSIRSLHGSVDSSSLQKTTFRLQSKLHSSFLFCLDENGILPPLSMLPLHPQKKLTVTNTSSSTTISQKIRMKSWLIQQIQGEELTDNTNKTEFAL